MIRGLRDWIDDRYFENLRRDASRRMLQAGRQPPDQQLAAAERAHNASILIDAMEVVCKLSRKLTEQPLDEAGYLYCLLDFDKLLGSIFNFSEGTEHDLAASSFKVLSRAMRTVKLRGQLIAERNPEAAARMHYAFQAGPFARSATWAELRALVSELQSKHFG